MQSDTSPLWFELLKATIGPVIAAVVFIVGLIWRDRIERRNAAQAWFEQRYIEEGMDVLSAHLSTLRNIWVKGRQRIFQDTITPLSPAVHRRLATLLPNDDLLVACEMVEAITLAALRAENPITVTEKEQLEVSHLCQVLGSLVESTRSALLRFGRIHSKSDVYRVRYHKEMQAFFKEAEYGVLIDGRLTKTLERFREKFLSRLEYSIAITERPRSTQ